MFMKYDVTILFVSFMVLYHVNPIIMWIYNSMFHKEMADPVITFICISLKNSHDSSIEYP